MKRTASECSDNDVFFDDGDMLKDGSPSQSCYRSDRKRRRGVIEKRRRDRINNSLSELRRLVPAAFEKQDSAKLEKAEILQMTVDHLKSLHSKGGYSADTASLAMDYRLVGFRECAAEVSRYLVSVEGLDLQDPLRLRLISHLQCYSAQREASAKACTGPPSLPLSGVTAAPTTAPPPPPPPPPHPWNHHHQYAPPSGPAAPTAVMPMHNASQHPAVFDQPGPGGGSSYLEALGRGPVCQQAQRVDGITSNVRLTSTVGGVNASQLNVSSPATAASSQIMPSTQQSAAAASLFGVHHAAQFLGAAAAAGMNSMPMLSPNGLHYGSPAAAAAMFSQGVKPYRPWGAELAY